ncbi:glycerate kinase [Paenibacillus sp. PAMC21692]|uniref:glycerate kinase n=1 Tax=Paenibacillus sp. PAMC21692 TaxID=2762320 RepID=UPI00164D96F8|nr:glycerate kinase [Paenibacillus sp. PAMC21692]QNK56093.1 glycerate kinase [Paenibacillus sp. PAMC21692]
MKVLLAFDSFKGSLSSLDAGTIAAEAIREINPDAECDVIPLADGGEGTVEAVAYASKGELINLRTSGPLRESVSSPVALIPDRDGERTAVLESASICGLTMMPAGRLDPLAATSTGIGEVITELLDLGMRRFAIGLGGSAVNDGGMGMLAALGAEFLDADGNRLNGSGGDLLKLASMSLAGLDERLSECRITIATDVDNPLCGELGATYIYGRQKGVTEELAAPLDQAMLLYGSLLEEELEELPSYRSRHVAKMQLQAASQSQSSSHSRTLLRDRPGAGAAGGLGFALMALGGEAASGADWMMSRAGFADRASGADWIVTGEGRSDRQTLHGKLPMRVAEAARQSGARCILMSGSLGDGITDLAPHFAGCFSIVKEPSKLAQCIEQAGPLLKLAVGETFRLIRSAEAVRHP